MDWLSGCRISSPIRQPENERSATNASDTFSGCLYPPPRQPENHCSTPTRFKTPIPIQHKRKNTACRQAVAAREPFQAVPVPPALRQPKKT
ncbi:hypothetical protein [Kingella oralis]